MSYKVNMVPGLSSPAPPVEGPQVAGDVKDPEELLPLCVGNTGLYVLISHTPVSYGQIKAMVSVLSSCPPTVLFK